GFRALSPHWTPRKNTIRRAPHAACHLYGDDAFSRFRPSHPISSGLISAASRSTSPDRASPLIFIEPLNGKYRAECLERALLYDSGSGPGATFRTASLGPNPTSIGRPKTSFSII